MSDPRVVAKQTAQTHRIVSAADRNRAARAFAQWHLGDADWWDTLQAAAADPDGTLRTLEAEGFSEEDWPDA
jgi:uncharacterized protein YbjT (DUF2867 family)